ncbi:MAG: uroporphyrinogen-III synthase [Candidatus Dormibacteraceae bacterium]
MKATTGLPLAGRRIVITRARDQASGFHQALVELGATVVDLPTIEIRDPDSWEPLDSAIARMNQFNFLILTSVNGVRSLVNRLRACGRDTSDLERLEVGAIGPATAEALHGSGVRVDFMPQEYQAEGLLESLNGCDVRGKQFLIPRAKVARDLVPRELTKRGASVEVVEAYQTVTPGYAPGEVKRRLTPRPDVLTFTSSSTASHFVKLVMKEGLFPEVKSCLIASIGPITSATLRKLGMQVAVEAKESTVPGLIKAIANYVSTGSV